jgi:ABC-type nitrate/sulfonate/bicarbonate transport system substrate-binding protein
MIRRYSFVCATLYVAWFLVFASPVSAQLTRVNVGYSAISADQLPAWVAKETGIFDQSGFIDGLYEKK